jgi:nitroreductase
MQKADALYNQITQRKSVRQYKMDALDVETLQKIDQFIQQLVPMDPEIEVSITRTPYEAMGKLFSIKAPYYMTVASEPAGNYLENAGFMLQQLDLFLPTLGLGGCWVGMAKPSKSVGFNKSHEFIIAYAFGKPEIFEPRTSVTQFSRLPLNKIHKGERYNDLVELARLAPSATNSQPWFYVDDDECIHIYRVRQNIFKGLIFERLNRIDIGIGLFHLYIAALVKGHTPSFIMDETPEIKDYQYVMTVKFN